MTKITYIPGEIANAAIDEHGNRKPVTRTHHIFDDAKGKSQAEVNADVDDSLADRYTKAETYNKSELNSMITTPDQKYVTVTATAQTTAATDVLPEEGGADTIYRVGNWDGSQFDTSVYSEYSWDGSQYVHLNTKSQIGEVFDISAYHATGGELAKYADLTAALGVDAANIPSSVRRGGMSIKFVQSSYNKYVQFRLMSTSFSTDEDDWQGVDDVPTVSSDNLVKSGGVYKLNRVLSTNLENKAENITFISGKTFDYDGSILDVAAHYCISSPISVKRGDVFVQTNTVRLTDGFAVVCETDDNGSYYKPLKFIYANKLTYVCEKDGYISFNSRTDYTPSISIYSSDAYESIVAHTNKKLSNKYFLDGGMITNQVIELYLIGLDSSKSYYVKSIGLYSNNNNLMTIYEYGGDEVARCNNVPTTGIIEVFERNNSGISGYAILNIHDEIVYASADDDYKNTKSGEIDIDVVSNLDESPSIKSLLLNIKKLDNRYFHDAGVVSNNVVELYLIGLNTENTYNVALLKTSNNYYRLSIYNNSNVEVARYYGLEQPNGITVLTERNSSGISGYAIFKDLNELVAGDDALESGLINQEIVGNIDYSPTIKATLGLEGNDGPLFEIKNIEGIDYVNMFDSIQWNQGFLYVYYNADGTYADSKKNCRKNTSDTDYKYAAPFLMKKGDIIQWNSGLALKSTAATAAVCVTDESGYVFDSILDIREQASGRNNYRFVADRDMYVSCNIRVSGGGYSADAFKWYRSKLLADSVDNLHERSVYFSSNKFIPLLEQLKTIDTYEANYVPQLCLLHFSDIHNDFMRIRRIMQFKEKFSKYIDNVIVTGDVAGGTYYNFEREILNIGGWEDVLMVIGNHDVYDHNGDAVEQGASSYADRAFWATQEEKYTLWMQGKANAESTNDNIAGWGVIQPSGVGVDNYYPCYYYKDYTDQKVRLIVLDTMDEDGADTQLAWFTDVLANAVTLGLHVIVANHFAPRISYADTLYLNCGFNCVNDYGFDTIGVRVRTYAEAVDTFIGNGGNFICWLCGHFHWDVVATCAAHPKQLFIAIASGSIAGWMQQRERTIGQESEDLFNMISIDTNVKMIRVARIGSKFDRFLNHAGTMCISYDGSGNRVPHLLSSW